MKYPEILSIRPEPAPCSYDDTFTMLYAVALGAGVDPEDIDLIYERNLKALPTMAALLSKGSGAFFTQGGIDMARLVHGEQRLVLHRPLPPAGSFTTQSRCVGVVDKGREKGALLTLESTICEAASGAHVATATSTLFCRGDGGCGAPNIGDQPPRARPDRAPDLEIALPTLPQQAVLYRLLGDRTPLHIDPEFAALGGFPRPILHGLCTYGIAARAVLKSCCDNEPARIERFDARFSAPVYPGETLVTRIWRDDREIAFECGLAERDVTVLRNGFCLLRDQ